MADQAFDHSRREFLWTGAAALLATAAPGLAIAQPAAGKPKIGVIGAGNIGGTIGGLWVKAGYEVFFSSRHPEELKPLSRFGLYGVGSNRPGVLLDAIADGILG